MVALLQFDEFVGLRPDWDAMNNETNMDKVVLFCNS
jgi:hypothetical protein